MRRFCANSIRSCGLTALLVVAGCTVVSDFDSFTVDEGGGIMPDGGVDLGEMDLGDVDMGPACDVALPEYQTGRCPSTASDCFATCRDSQCLSMCALMFGIACNDCIKLNSEVCAISGECFEQWQSANCCAAENCEGDFGSECFVAACAPENDALVTCGLAAIDSAACFATFMRCL